MNNNYLQPAQAQAWVGPLSYTTGYIDQYNFSTKMSQLRIKIGHYYNFTIDKEPAMSWVIRLSPFWEGEGRSYLLQRLLVAIQRGT